MLAITLAVPSSGHSLSHRRDQRTPAQHAYQLNQRDPNNTSSKTTKHQPSIRGIKLDQSSNRGEEKYKTVRPSAPRHQQSTPTVPRTSNHSQHPHSHHDQRREHRRRRSHEIRIRRLRTRIDHHPQPHRHPTNNHPRRHSQTQNQDARAPH